MTTKKSFDCVRMKRAAQGKIRARVKGMTPEQEIAFLRTGQAEFRKAIVRAKWSRTRETIQ